MMMNQQMHQITMISEVVSDLLDFLGKKEEFKIYLKEKQLLRQEEAQKNKTISEDTNDVDESDNK